MGFKGQFARQQPRAAHVRLGSKTDLSNALSLGQLSSIADIMGICARSQLRAKSRLMQRNKRALFDHLVGDVQDGSFRLNNQ